MENFGVELSGKGWFCDMRITSDEAAALAAVIQRDLDAVAALETYASRFPGRASLGISLPEGMLSRAVCFVNPTKAPGCFIHFFESRVCPGDFLGQDLPVPTF